MAAAEQRHLLSSKENLGCCGADLNGNSANYGALNQSRQHSCNGEHEEKKSLALLDDQEQ